MGVAYLPFWVLVRQERASVCPRQHNQTAVATVNMLHGGPGADNAISRSEGEVVEICRDSSSWSAVDSVPTYLGGVGVVMTTCQGQVVC